MTSKDAINLHKAWDSQPAAGFTVASLIARFKKIVSFEIPIGYQDENGFHYGAEPKQEEFAWPEKW